jgi:hypothetical protein
MDRREIDRRDRRSGFTQIGYHYVIERDGKWLPGRPELSASVHDDLNKAKDALSVCIVGSPGNFTIEQQEAFKEFCLHKGMPMFSEIKGVPTDNLVRWAQGNLSNEWLMITTPTS